MTTTSILTIALMASLVLNVLLILFVIYKNRKVTESVLDSISNFTHLEKLDADILNYKIATMNTEEKFVMLEDLLKHGEDTENNLRVAVVIQQNIIEELKPEILL